MVHRSAVVAAGPSYKSMQIDGNDIRVRFSDIGGGLRVADPKAELRGFAIAAQTGDFVWAVARIEGDTVIVNNASLQDPVAVRYDWSNTPKGNLVNKEGLPALPFRTDQSP
jgi:sialate O-acetylesterase